MRNVPIGFMCLTLGPAGSTVLGTMEYIGGSSLAGGSISLGNALGVSSLAPFPPVARYLTTL